MTEHFRYAGEYMKQPGARYVHCLYCDDIRQEIGGKVTFVGTCSHVPVSSGTDRLSVPKLCIATTFGTPKSDPVKSLQIKIGFNGRGIHALERIDVAETPKDAPDGLLYGTMITLAPFSTREEGTLNAIAVTDREKITGNPLKIVFSKPQQTASPQNKNL